MSKKIVIVDYGVGNLRSVARAVEYCGGSAILTDQADEINAAGRVILPGVGAFASCMSALQERNLVEPLKEVMQSNRPLLGICVGMQMMMQGSDEFGTHEGFGLIPGWVRSLPTTDKDGVPCKVPHIGWSGLKPPREDSWANSPLRTVEPGSAFYFVHSYAAIPEHEDNVLAYCSYGGRDFCAAVRKENVFGVQFHPEKSGHLGLGMLSNFLAA